MSLSSSSDQSKTLFDLALEGKKALVTGSTRGIGFAIAQSLAAHGAHVIVHGRDSEKAAAAKEALPGSGHFSVSADLEDPLTAVPKLVEQLSLPIDILVNNAGITRDRLMMQMSDDDWNKVINVNLTSTFALCRAVSKSMIRQRSGVIINLTSVVALRGQGGQSNYAASKAGLIGLTKSLARELASREIRVNAVAPGFIASDMTSAIPDVHRDKILASIPFQRMGKDREVAQSVTFLASQWSSYITGHVLVVDGGMAI